jgi:hypothetical protein
MGPDSLRSATRLLTPAIITTDEVHETSLPQRPRHTPGAIFDIDILSLAPSWNITQSSVDSHGGA